MEDTMKQDGTITLPYFQKFHGGQAKPSARCKPKSANVTCPSYWKYLTVTIKIADRFYFVGGEVRAPGRQVYNGPMTVLKAIDYRRRFHGFCPKRKRGADPRGWRNR